MSAARCSSCHTYCRNCPVGQPNHKTVPNVGPTCTMNSLGRHYRDPTNPNQPSCNYEAGGVRCSFSQIVSLPPFPYPDDISFGPVSNPSPNTHLATILAALNMQKEEADAHRKRQDEQMKLLQSQVNGLLQGATQPPVSSVTDTMTTQALTTTVVTTTVNSQPTVMV